MDFDSSRRKLLKAGAILPVTGFVSAHSFDAFAKTQDEKMLYTRNEEIRPNYCRMCYECKGQCPNGVPVTDVLRFLAYNDFGDNLHQAQDNFRSLPDEIRSVRCNDCSACAIECPNGVDVRNRLIRAQELLA